MGFHHYYTNPDNVLDIHLDIIVGRSKISVSGQTIEALDSIEAAIKSARSLIEANKFLNPKTKEET